jgi:hypothetical protein
MRLPSSASQQPAANYPFRTKLQAAMILRGVVRLRLDEGEVEVQPRTWYREGGTQYLEAKRRDSGERMRVKLDQIRDVKAY